jgi:hypothetical protein
MKRKTKEMIDIERSATNRWCHTSPYCDEKKASACGAEALAGTDRETR